MGGCCVEGCHNSFYTAKRDGIELSFFRFPKDEEIRKAWLENMGQVDMAPEHDSMVCSIHFTEDCMKPPNLARFKDGITPKRKRILHTAVPTLNMGLSKKGLNGATRIDLDKTRQHIRIPITSLDANKKRKAEAHNSKRRISIKKSPGGRLSRLRKQSLNSYSDEQPMKSRLRRLPRTSVERYPTRTRRIVEKYDLFSTSKLETSTKTSEDNDSIEEYSSEEEWLTKKRRRRFLTRNSEENDDADSDEDEDEDDNKKNEHDEKEEDVDPNMLLEIEKLKRLNSELNTKLQAIDEEKKRSNLEVKNLVESVLKPYFTEGQIKCIVEGRKWVNWSIDDYASAISLRSISAKAYWYMRKKLNFPLPSLSALRRWVLSQFDVHEGFLTDVLAVMREKSKALSSMDKMAVLTFDELTLTPEVCFDSKLEKLIGPCGKVRVIMVHGLFGNWQQPIYYKFDQPMTKAILDEALTRLYDAGYQVVATICDSSHLSPRGILGELGINVDNHFFPHPSIQGAVVYVFIDVPHLLKLLRNWLMDEGFLLHSSKEKFTADIYQTLVNLRSECDLPVAHRVTQLVLDARNTLKEAVWPAAHIWSRSAGKAIQCAGDRGLLDTTEHTKFADFVLAVNSWFDVQNSLKKYGAHPGVNGFGVDLDQQERVLLLMTLYMQQMRTGSQRSLMPFQQGVIMSNASLRGLYRSLKNKYPGKFECLATRRLQLDVLQHFFSHIRAAGAAKDHPSGYEFRCRLRSYMLGKYRQAVFSIGRNSEEDSNVRLSLSPPVLSLDSDTVLVHNRSSPLPVLTPHSSEPEDRFSVKRCDISHILNNCDMTSIRSEISSTHYSSSLPEYDVEPSPTAEVVLTQELFMSIINIPPDELAEDLDDQSDTNLDKDCSETIQQDHDDYIDELDEISQIQYIQEPFGCQNGKDVNQDAGLKYLAGYVAHRFLRKYSFLGESVSQVDDAVSNERPDRIQMVSRGHFMQPSRTLLDLAKAVEICFKQFHGKRFSKEDQVIQKVVKLVKNTKQYNEWIPEEVLQCLVRTRTYIRVRELNKQMCSSSEIETVEEKIKKLPKNWKPFAKRTLQYVSPKTSN